MPSSVYTAVDLKAAALVGAGAAVVDDPFEIGDPYT